MKADAKNNCINCEHFAWWDGDYCCVKNFKILCESKSGHFNEDILTAIKTPKTCNDYKKAKNKKMTEIYQEAYIEFLKEYESKVKENQPTSATSEKI